jgi:3-hydroxyphenylacetate 6-hydroxylase
LTKELGRYFMVLRLALPKATATSARWEQYTIPENTVVFLNSWACGRDPEELEEAWAFRPERWLGNSDKHTHQFSFGFGGRMCVASHVSHNALYTVYLHLLAHFEIRPVEGETSESAIDPLESLKDVEGTAATPRKFKARFIPRNKALLKDYIVNVVHTER